MRSRQSGMRRARRQAPRGRAQFIRGSVFCTVQCSWPPRRAGAGEGPPLELQVSGHHLQRSEHSELTQLLEESTFSRFLISTQSLPPKTLVLHCILSPAMDCVHQCAISFLETSWERAELLVKCISIRLHEKDFHNFKITWSETEYGSFIFQLWFLFIES